MTPVYVVRHPWQGLLARPAAISIHRTAAGSSEPNPFWSVRATVNRTAPLGIGFYVARWSMACLPRCACHCRRAAHRGA